MDHSAALPQPRPYRMEREPGGRLPEVGALLSATIAEFTDNLGPYAMAGLGLFLVGIVLSFVLIPLIYFGMMFVMFGGMFASVLLGAGVAGASGSDDAGAAAMLVGYLGSFGLMFVFVFALVAVLGTAMAPVNASLTRAVAAHQRGERKLDLNAAFSTATQDLGSVLVVAGLYMGAITLASMACYLPALLVVGLASMAPPMVYLHREGGLAALTAASRHAGAHLGFYVPFALVLFVSGMLAAYVPVVGPMFGVALHVRAYRELFGDGEAPVLAA